MTDTVLTETMAVPPPEPPPPPSAGAGDWVRRNLFRSRVDGVVTIVAGAIAGYVIYRLARFVFVTGRWDIVRSNLKLFMVGRYPDDDLWRIGVVLAGFALYGGLVAGFIARRRVMTGRVDPDAPTRGPVRTALALLGRLWPLVVGVGLLLLLASSPGPWILVGATLLAALVGRMLGPRLPRRAPLALVVVGLAGFIAAIWFLAQPWGWDGWGGLMLNVFLAVAGITLCFPLGVLLAVGRAAGREGGNRFNGFLAAVVLGVLPLIVYAVVGINAVTSWTTVVVLVMAAALAAAGWRLGRASGLPLVRALSIGYIEAFRGVPLFVLLLLSYLALGFFLPTWYDDPPGLVVRSIVAITLFTAAYVAEIVRGGLQSLPKGQTEAAQALGLSPVKTLGLVVLPQALRNVIPALVGQFISLFKDTTLAAAAMSLLDLLNVAKAVPSQPAFQGQGLTAETLSFVMFVFWVGCITMSRESQRLERKLGVGTR